MPVYLSRYASLVFGVGTIFIVAVAFSFWPFGSAADVQIAQNVLTQGRALTPAGKLIVDATTNLPAVGSLTNNFVRSPDRSGADGRGRYLIAVNSGYGLKFNSKSKPQQSLSVIDLNAKPEPIVVQNVYFPSPSSANFGATFSSRAEPDGSFRLYLAGGFENRIWIFKFSPIEKQPISPANKSDAPLSAPFIDVSAFATNAPSPNYNGNVAAVYPTGIALAPDDNTLFVANNLGDTLGIVSDLRDARTITRVPLQRPNSTQFVYPYDVKVLPARDQKSAAKIYVSLWGDGSIAVIDPAKADKPITHITVDRHPTAMIFSRDQSKLLVVNSDADTVSVIDTARDQEIERINVGLVPNEARLGASPEGLALSEDEKTLYVANAHANAVAVVRLANSAQAGDSRTNLAKKNLESKNKSSNQTGSKKSENSKNSQLLGLIPTGNYPSAIAAVNNQLFIANGKGTGVESSSNVVNNSGRAPNMPNAEFPADRNGRGQYNPSLVVSNFSLVNLPAERDLFAYTQSVLRNNNLIGDRKTQLFSNAQSPFQHVIYIIRENRTYDQVFGDLNTSGDGTKADGAPSVAIFGAGEAAKSPGGTNQNLTPNARALALRFGLLDRFFVNAEASPDGHNWSTAAFSNDFIDKSFRWNYSSRGRTYDFEGFNRLPAYDPPANQPPVSLPSVFNLPANETDVANYLKKYVPYLNGNRDIGEPQSLYLWDAAKKAGLTYRNYGEYVATVSAEDVREINTRAAKKYPDISETLEAFATKKTLENNFSPAHRNFDQNTPDSMTADSYRAARESNDADLAIVTRDNKDVRFRGNSRFGEWQHEFRGYVADLQAGKGDRLPNLSIIRFSNDHTAGLRSGMPTPQFYVAENDYALGRLVEEVSNSPFWRNTAVFVVEDDAQDGPDHVDAHRSPAFVISAYNRRGALVHEFHNTVSLIRTLELCLGLEPMNVLDAHAAPIEIFANEPDFTSYHALMPEIALDNLFPSEKPSAEMRNYIHLSNEQNFAHADAADPSQLNEIIWFSARGSQVPMPANAHFPAFDLMKAGIKFEKSGEDEPDNNYRKPARNTFATKNLGAARNTNRSED